MSKGRITGESLAKMLLKINGPQHAVKSIDSLYEQGLMNDVVYVDAREYLILNSPGPEPKQSTWGVSTYKVGNTSKQSMSNSVKEKFSELEEALAKQTRIVTILRQRASGYITDAVAKSRLKYSENN